MVAKLRNQNDNFVLTSISQSLLTIYPPGGFRALIGGRSDGKPEYRYHMQPLRILSIVQKYVYKNNPLPQLGGKKKKKEEIKDSSERKGYFC